MGFRNSKKQLNPKSARKRGILALNLFKASAAPEATKNQRKIKGDKIYEEK